MESLKGILFQVGELSRVIHYLLIFSCYVRKDFLLSLRKRWRMEGWGGVAVCWRSPKISHLFFANDSLIFCRASLEECDALQRVLRVYEGASGQQLNRAKTSLFFSRNTPNNIQEIIKDRFRAQVIKHYEKYMGLPSLLGRNKKNTFNSIKDKLRKQLAGWKEKLLSKARKEVLIKVVAQAIPTYTMSVFKLSDSLCEDLTSMIRNFWWR